MHEIPDNPRRSDTEPPETVPSAGWRETYDTYEVDPSIEPDDECAHPECDEDDDLELCVILGGVDPEVRVTCPAHWRDTLEVTT
jgi:hypothetical protein